MDAEQLYRERSATRLNRRKLITGLGVAAGAATMLGATGCSNAGPALVATPAGAGPSVLDVLNFALNLEYLEANFYLYATTGAGLTSTQSGGGPAVQNPPVVTLSGNTLAVAQALAQDEINHIADLKAAITSLGGTPIAQPEINLGANGNVTTVAQFLAAARQFTALGGSAYVGSAQYLVSQPTVLTAAGQILGAEGQHAGALSYLCVSQGVASGAIDAQDVPPSATNYFTVQAATALGVARTTSEVLGVAYGISTPTTTTPPTGKVSGGFFPNGVNGNIKST